MSWIPHVTVAAVIHKDDRFLLVEEFANGREVLNQPAGHLDPGESLVEAVVRETLEETAWRFEPKALCGIYQWTHPEKQKTFIRFAFTGDVLEHLPGRDLDAGIIRAVWLDRGQVLARSGQLRSPMVMRCIDDYLAGQRFPLNLVRQLSLTGKNREQAS
jgi:8-oxo-dGTP pyrophosphatase MutT (NUDIX family)